MNGIDFLVDTNVLIYTLEGHPAVLGITQCSIAGSVIHCMMPYFSGLAPLRINCP
jgi:hypothetical protein